MAKDSFIFHLEYAEELEELTFEEQGMILHAMIKYTSEGVSPAFEDKALRIVWKTICRRLDADNEAYEAKCKRNADNAKKGGAPKGNHNAKKTTENNPIQPNGCINNPKQPANNPKQAKQPDTDTDIDIDTDITILANSNNTRANRPTLEEVETEIVLRGLKVKAETFLAFYNSQGWIKSNGLPVTDWKSELQLWSIREGERKTKSSQTKKPSVNNFSEKQDYNMAALIKAAKG